MTIKYTQSRQQVSNQSLAVNSGCGHMDGLTADLGRWPMVDFITWKTEGKFEDPVKFEPNNGQYFAA